MKTDEDKSTEPKKEECKHLNSYVVKEGMLGILGTVKCPDCGYEREWDAY
jgi:hypothetical protein